MRVSIVSRLALGAVAFVFAASFTVVNQVSASSIQNYTHKVDGYCLMANSSGTTYKTNVGCPNSNGAVTGGSWQVITNGSYRLLKNVKNGKCLDSNRSRQVYTKYSCSTGNTYQNWQVIHNGNYIMFKDRATGYCLDGGYKGSAVYTNPCSTGNSYQQWY